MLSSAMSMLRRCRVNAALTIQLFSQLFHSVNMWLFNKLVASSDAVRLCCRQWGIRIRARLAMVESWAERQVRIVIQLVFPIEAICDFGCKVVFLT